MPPGFYGGSTVVAHYLRGFIIALPARRKIIGANLNKTGTQHTLITVVVVNLGRGVCRVSRKNHEKDRAPHYLCRTQEVGLARDTE